MRASNSFEFEKEEEEENSKSLLAGVILSGDHHQPTATIRLEQLLFNSFHISFLALTFLGVFQCAFL